MADASANISEKRSFSPVWIVPILAVLIGIWMVVYTIQSQGPDITIVFSTAEGIETGKTKIKFRDVEVGLVDSVGLAEDHESVIVIARVDKASASLLREDTQFWVVRPRVGLGGVSGLGTLLSGGYVQLAPGAGEEGRREFEAPHPVPRVGLARRNRRLLVKRSHDDGRHEYEQLAAVLAYLLRPEQASEDRDVAEQRDLVHVLQHRVVDQSGDREGLAVCQFDLGLGLARQNRRDVESLQREPVREVQGRDLRCDL